MGNAPSRFAYQYKNTERELWYYAKYGQETELRQALLRMHSNPPRSVMECRDLHRGRTPLGYACDRGHATCVSLLLDAGADVNARDDLGLTPLHLAIRKSYRHVLHLLLDYPYVDLFAKGGSRRETPLEYARHLYTTQEGVEKRQTVRCIQQIETKLSIYREWLELCGTTSWSSRYCMVLRTKNPNVVEMNLFSIKRGDKRPTLPSTEIVHIVANGVQEGSNVMNNRKYQFSLTGQIKSQVACDPESEQFAFAVDDEWELIKWKSVLAGQQMAVPAIVSNPSASTHDEQQELSLTLELSREDINHHAVPTGSAPPMDEADFMTSPERVDGVLSESEPTSVGQSSTADEDRHESCVICFDATQEAVCVPCGHNVVCMDCSKRVMDTTKQCPMCRLEVREMIKLFRG